MEKQQLEGIRKYVIDTLAKIKFTLGITYCVTIR
jgi:hypothetical protein